MSNFKVGDWVRNRIHIDEKHMVFDKIEATNEGFEFLYFSNNKMGLLQDYEPWQPKEGEWCWFYTKGSVPAIGKYLEFNGNKHIGEHHIHNTIPPLVYGTNVEPFIGELPTFIKDKQWKIIA